MRILFLTNTLNMGGIETNLVRLTAGFTARGHDVVAATAGGRLEDAFAAAGGRHHRVQISLSPSRLASGVRHLSAVLRHENPDIVHAFSAPAAVTLWAAKRWRFVKRPRQLPTVSSIMGLNSSPEEHPWITRLRAWLTCMGMDKVVVIAPAIAQVLAQTPAPTQRLISLPVVGVDAPVHRDPQDLRDVRRELGVDSRFMVLTVGNLEPRKSHELFIAAASSIASKRDDVSFFIAGEGFERSRLESQIGHSGHAEQITLLGERADAERLIAATDVYVKPGVVEGFIGITVLEAQAHGVPVVAFETEDVKLAIEDNTTGRLVPRGNVARLAEAINELLEDESLRHRLGAAGREHVTRQFSIDSVTAGLESLYVSLVTQSEMSGSV